MSNSENLQKFLTVFLLQFITVSTLLASDGFLDCLKNDGKARQKTLIILYRPDCPYCKQMDKAIGTEALFQQKLTRKFRVYVLNINSKEGRIFADRFNIHGVPAVVSLNNKTGEHSIINGFGSTRRLEEALELLPVQHRDQPVLPAVWEATGQFATCGNGKVEAGETCDDGNLANNDGCSGGCNVEQGWQCAGSNPSVCAPVCGDGFLRGNEQCDDGNLANNDGCSATCNIQPGYACSGSPSICLAICGDGIKTGSEQCDDGNTANSDGCSSTCGIESGWNCFFGSPTACSPVCGDGLLRGNEQCDDGNLINGDGCNDACILENGPAGILIKSGAGTADYSALLDLNSTQRGILIPRLTTAQRNAISAPAKGLMVYDSTAKSFWYYGGQGWKEIRSDVSNAAFSAFVPAASQSTVAGSTIFVNFPSEEFDDGGNNYNPATSSYTVPASGVYQFSATVLIALNTPTAANTSYTMQVYESVGFTTHLAGTSTVIVPPNQIGGIYLNATGTVKLVAGTGGIVRVTISSSANSASQLISSGKFSGHRVY